MTRRNPQVESLERENQMLRNDIARMRQPPGDMPPDLGCGDGSCVVRPPQGMHTNGGCRCDERMLRRAVQWWRRVAEFRLATIREMKDAGEGEK